MSKDVCPRLSGSNSWSEVSWRRLPGEISKSQFSKEVLLLFLCFSLLFDLGNKVQWKELPREAERFCSRLGGRTATGGDKDPVYDFKQILFL